MATVRPPVIQPPASDHGEGEWQSEEYTHLQQERLAHEEPSFAETLKYIGIAVVIVGSILGAAIWYLVTH